MPHALDRSQEDLPLLLATCGEYLAHLFLLTSRYAADIVVCPHMPEMTVPWAKPNTQAHLIGPPLTASWQRAHVTTPQCVMLGCVRMAVVASAVEQLSE